MEPFLVPLDGPAEALRAVIEPALTSVGLELVQLHFVRGTHKDTLRLFIDRKAGGISVGDLEKANRLLSDLLDVADQEQHLFPHAYDLEVSSPGVDRPLTKRSHFERAVGEKVRVKTRVPLNNASGLGARSFTGKLVAVDDAVHVDALAIPFDDIQSAHVVFEFQIPQKPGKRK